MPDNDHPAASEPSPGAPSPPPDIGLGVPVRSTASSPRRDTASSAAGSATGRGESDKAPPGSKPAAIRMGRPLECENCGKELLGDTCYACGQPVKGLVRQFTSIMGDFVDTVFNLDARVFRTLGPLFLRPGYLSLEYFLGHRIRYVSPVRLFIFLSIITFFFARMGTDWSDGDVTFDGDSEIESAMTVADVELRRDKALAALAAGRAEGKDVPGLDAGLQAAETAIREEAATRIKELQDAAERGEPPPVATPNRPNIRFNGGEWDAETNPVKIGWLPQFANDWINAQIGRGEKNIERIQQDPNLAKDAFLSTLTSTLILLLPLFALMLKVMYLFKKRLYMEHLIVALHSHAFLMLALLVMLAVLQLDALLSPTFSWLGAIFTTVEVLLWIWMPLYLLLMQKRVYAQGWLMTLLKFGVIGMAYFTLLVFGAVATLLAAIVWL